MICLVCDKSFNNNRSKNKVCCCYNHNKILRSIKNRKELFKLSDEEKMIYDKLKLKGLL